MRLLFAIALFTCLLAACGAPAGEPEVVASPVAELPTAEAPTPTETAEPTETPLSPTATPEPLTPSEIFTRLSPSVAYISVPGSSGSGALIDGGYIVTNYHIVWPHTAADVTFPDGAKFDDVALVAADPLLDLALLGPIEVDLPPIAFVDGESAVVGGDILLIGYPGESSRSPQPTLTEGLISRVREWEEGGVTFFQTSSAVAGGQSGGIAVSPEGQAVGLSGLRFTEANYGLIASAADLLPVIDDMLARAGRATPDTAEPRTVERDNFDLSRDETQHAYRVMAPAGERVEITVDGPGNLDIGAYVPNGTELAYADDTITGPETLRFTMPSDAIPVYVVVNYLSNFTGRFSLRSDQPLFEINDLDEGFAVIIGRPYEGSIDFPGDHDTLVLVLDEGEEVTIRVDTIGFDPLLVIDAKAKRPDTFVSDDNSGGGLFDTSAELTYRAPRAGTYDAIIVDLFGNGAGSSYTVTLNEPYEGAPTAMAPQPTPTPITSAVGDMRLYDDPLLPFTFEVPVEFERGVNHPTCESYDSTDQPGICLTDAPFGMSGLVIIAVSDHPQQLAGQALTLDTYLSLLLAAYETNPQLGVPVQREIETANGSTAVVLDMGDFGENTSALRFVHVQPGRAANNITLVYDSAMQETVDYIISTYQPRR